MNSRSVEEKVTDQLVYLSQVEGIKKVWLYQFSEAPVCRVVYSKNGFTQNTIMLKMPKEVAWMKLASHGFEVKTTTNGSVSSPKGTKLTLR